MSPEARVWTLLAVGLSLSAALLWLTGCAIFRSPPGPTPPVLCAEPSIEAWLDFGSLPKDGAGQTWVVNIYEHTCKQNAAIRKNLGYAIPVGLVK